MDNLNLNKEEIQGLVTYINDVLTKNTGDPDTVFGLIVISPNNTEGFSYISNCENDQAIGAFYSLINSWNQEDIPIPADATQH